MSACDDECLTNTSDNAGADPTGSDGKLDSVVDRRCVEFTGVFSRESVTACVRSSYERLGPARIEMYQPLLAYRYARDQLRATAVCRMCGAA